jgi:hypothetical protein
MDMAVITERTLDTGTEVPEGMVVITKVATEGPSRGDFPEILTNTITKVSSVTRQSCHLSHSLEDLVRSSSLPMRDQFLATLPIAKNLPRLNLFSIQGIHCLGKK